ERTSPASLRSRATSRVWSSRGLLLAPELFEALVTAAIPAVEFVTGFVLLVIVLVVVLSCIERPGRDNLRIDGARRELRLDLFIGLLRSLLLFLGAIEDRRAVLIAVVAELLVLHQRIDAVPIRIEQLGVRNLRGIVDDLDRLGVPGAAGRHLLISRILYRAA